MAIHAMSNRGPGQVLQRGDCLPVLIIAGVVSIVAAGMIAMLVMGSLGCANVVSMSRGGAIAMVVLGVNGIISFPIAACKLCCSK